MKKKTTSTDKKVKLKAITNLTNAIIDINATFNNTCISISDNNGNVIKWATAGTCGYKGTKKSTPYAAQIAASRIAESAVKLGVQAVVINAKGHGPGREPAIRTIATQGIKINSLNDVTPIPHNGCRPPKKPRK